MLSLFVDGLPRPTALFLMVHAAFRRDAGRFAEVLRTHQGPERIARLASHWELYSGMLLSHHQQEDAHLFTMLAHADERLEGLIPELEREHSALGPLLGQIGELFETQLTPRAELVKLFEKLEALLDEHLSKEEQYLVPVMERCGIIPGGGESQEGDAVEREAAWWEALAFPWVAEGIADATLEAILPKGVKERFVSDQASYRAHVNGLWA